MKKVILFCLLFLLISACTKDVAPCDYTLDLSESFSPSATCDCLKEANSKEDGTGYTKCVEWAKSCKINKYYTIYQCKDCWDTIYNLKQDAIRAENTKLSEKYHDLLNAYIDFYKTIDCKPSESFVGEGEKVFFFCTYDKGLAKQVGINVINPEFYVSYERFNTNIY